MEKENSNNPSDYFEPGTQEYQYMRKMTSQIAIYYARKSPVDFEELVAEGLLGAVKSADKYDPNTGNKYSTLLYHYISGYIKNLVRKHIKDYGNGKMNSISQIEDEFESEFISEALTVSNAYESIELDNLMSVLDEKQHAILKFKKEGYTDSEIADLIADKNGGKGMSRVSVINLKNKAIATLQAEVRKMKEV